MPIEVKRKEGESIGSLLFRFNKRVKHSGVLKEAKKKRFRQRPVNKIKVRQSTIYKFNKAQEMKRMKKLGYL